MGIYLRIFLKSIVSTLLELDIMVTDCLFFVLLVVYFVTVSTAVSYDRSIKAIKVKVPDSDEEFYLHPATVRRNDRSAQSVVCIQVF